MTDSGKLDGTWDARAFKKLMEIFHRRRAHKGNDMNALSNKQFLDMRKVGVRRQAGIIDFAFIACCTSSTHGFGQSALGKFAAHK
jgi:hypothetical protein